VLLSVILNLCGAGQLHQLNFANHALALLRDDGAADSAGFELQ